MKIWIDGYEANVLQRLGSSQVAFELLRSLEKIDRENDYTILLPAPPLGDLPKTRVGWQYKILKPKRLWTRITLPLALYTARQKPDIFFSPTHYIPRFAPTKIKKVVTVFDLSFLHFPEMFIKKDLWQLKNWTKFSVMNADRIITISRFSQDDIVKQYGLAREKITVAYPGYDSEKFKIQNSKLKILKIRKKYNIGDSYIIYIGTIQPRKNLERFIEAFSLVAEGGKLELVIVGKTSGEGKQGWMYEDILKAPKELGIEDRVKFLGFVSTDDLSALLQGARAYIQPSLWEGFGIPVLEAMASGTPVIVSNTSSLPEVVGKAGLLIDPYSLDQIEQAIRTIVFDKKLQQKYSKEGIIQAKKFSWDKMAKEVLKVFEEISNI
ncbi:hypothetical protein A3J19_05490 [Candidatus Daviesbacteria bacterium RIFCSPLOWO2_02_FULL_41_8]|uniref:Glycosyl transferase family 1 domain-containing protein n=1 Tax=Candidatus Daviesbacteria bacterium RIFCSPLOWO2_02_FULL_41_8 TaxID=1797798 RepID=A0A1F5NIA8_9BACT|nr:MAG: hypothetical protein A3J19_05490 [Candidatus Daviesbacteria bacterium RIFCSPLOWO2_02_FULL_41_8]